MPDAVSGLTAGHAWELGLRAGSRERCLAFGRGTSYRGSGGRQDCRGQL